MVSCFDQEETFGITNIIKGRQWNLKIGSSPEEAYHQLQELGKEKGFDDITLVGRSGEHLASIGDNLALYNAVIVLRPRYDTDSVYIGFKDEEVTEIKRWRDPLFVLEEWYEDETGEVPIPFVPGGLTLKVDILENWPEEIPETSIKLGDHVTRASEKLGEIPNRLGKTNMPIVLSEKNLEKEYDPEMARYTQWEFFFSEIRKDAGIGRYSMRLYFDNNKLKKIRKEYW
ncbi:hypothetical protein JM658_16190 [Joostella atrarenae]|uniref:Uncharacterized protein n=1 Tax=Joostella atrarenae TaxID=679257 RepID=A0ABS9J7F7_9FLAO|nr:hypothetical protein [Joostella atrarenae]MCF8716371.1 hypothetical protein [Joostella atrarenae]